MGYPNGQVDIAGLAEVGGHVTHTAETFEKAYSGQAAAVAPGSTLAGWATGAVLPAATEAWSQFVTDLAGQVRSFGTGLTTAANEYRRADQAAADRVGGAYGRAPR